MENITPESLFEARRHFLKLGAGALVSSSAVSQLLADLPKDLSLKYTPDSNPLKLTLNTEKQATNYVDFYEFSTDKTAPVKLSQNRDQINLLIAACAWNPKKDCRKMN